jgi:hypothetical protein
MRLVLAALLIAGCAEPAAVGFGHRALAIRPTDPRAPLWRYDPTDQVEHFDSAHFRVHFTRAGRHAVPDDDADADGVPDYVGEVAATYEDVLAFYTAQGFRPPVSDADLPGDNGGDGRFDVYLIDFARASDGNFESDACRSDGGTHCIGHVVQENDFAGYGYPSRQFATRVLASHEFFHAIQSAYDGEQDVIVTEGTAVWASDTFDPTLHELENFAPGYLADPGRSLDVPPGGPVPTFAYGASLFFRFLEERYDRDLIRKLWEHLEDGHGLGGAADPQWLDQLVLLLPAEYDSSFAEAFADFARWNLFTGPHHGEGYADAANYPAVTMDHVDLPFEKDGLRVFHASTQYREATPGDRASMTAALVATAAHPDALDGLVLYLTTERGGRYTAVQRVDDLAHPPEIATDGANRFVVAIVNTNPAGDSRRPSLCVGSPDEVAQCRAHLLGELDAAVADAAPPDDATIPDAAPEQPDAAAPDAAPEPDAAPDATPSKSGGGGGGGCAVGDPGPFPALLLLALPLCRRRPRMG